MIKTLVQNSSGYSLVELAISLTVIATLAAGGLTLVSRQQEQKALQITNERIAIVKSSIDAFALAEGYLPCPANPNITGGESNAAFGKAVEYIVTDQEQKCETSGTNVVDNAGAVPVSTLGLAYEYMYDSWGRKFTYRIAEGAGDKANYGRVDFRGNLRVSDLAGNSKVSVGETDEDQEGATYVVISHGENGDGIAWERRVKEAQSGALEEPEDGLERNNIKHGYNSYVQDVKTSNFDDILLFGTKPRHVAQTDIESPILVRSISCENADIILESGEILEKEDGGIIVPEGHVLNDYPNEDQRLQAYKSARLVSYLCDHQPGPVSPGNISGVRLWFDASDRKSVKGGNCGSIVDDGGSIGCMVDKSGYANAATDGSASYNVQDPDANGKAVMEFSNGRAFETERPVVKDSQAGRTLFLVLEPGSSLSGTFALAGGSGQDSYNVQVAKSGGEISVVANGGQYNFTAAVDSKYVLLVVKNPPSFELNDDGERQDKAVSISARVNGNDIGAASNASVIDINDSSNARLGGAGSSNFNGNLAEAIYYERHLSDSEIRSVEDFLVEKWGIEVSQKARCPNGLVFRRTAKDPEGDCYCEDHDKGERFKTVLDFPEDNTGCRLRSRERHKFGICTTAMGMPFYEQEIITNNLLAWFDANDCTAFTLQEGSEQIVSWADRSGQQVDASDDDSDAPSYQWEYDANDPEDTGFGYVRFNNSRLVLNKEHDYEQILKGRGPRTIFILARTASNDPKNVLLSLSDENEINDNKYMITPQLSVDFGREMRKIYSTSLGNEFSIIVVQNANYSRLGSTKLWHQEAPENGANDPDLIATGAAGPSVLDTSVDNPKMNTNEGGRSYLGSEANFTGDIAEVLIYASELDLSEIQTVVDYLKAKKAYGQ